MSKLKSTLITAVLVVVILAGFAYWLNQMLPIFDPEDYYTKFLQANSWTKTYLPNIDANQTSSYLVKIPESRLGKFWKNIFLKKNIPFRQIEKNFPVL